MDEDKQRSIGDNDLKLFSGMAVLLILMAAASYVMPEFRPLVVVQLGNLIGAGIMYLRGK